MRRGRVPSVGWHECATFAQEELLERAILPLPHLRPYRCGGRGERFFGVDPTNARDDSKTFARGVDGVRRTNSQEKWCLWLDHELRYLAMERIVALASSVVASIPTVLPFTSPWSRNTSKIQKNTAVRLQIHQSSRPRDQ